MAIFRTSLVTLALLSGCLNTVAEGSDGGTGGGSATGGGDAAGGGVATGGGSGGGSATGGGAATGGGSGDAGTCGCMTMGRCAVGDSPLACGNTGGVCSRCAQGEQCVNGQCTMAACGPGTCTGCCAMGFCITPSQQSGLACGAGGAMCTNCMMGQTCTNGACAARTCDSTNCANGCCAQGFCLQGMAQGTFACGTGAAMCMQCQQGQQCRMGACVTPPPMDAGQPAAIGSTCMNGGGGGCGMGRFCLPDQAGYPGGYCAAQCGMGGTCPGAATCVTTTGFGVSQSVCMATCGTCRSGYACQPQPDGGASYCRPSCTNGGFAANCPTGQTCVADAGICM